jgi:hypothetical protein
MAMLRGIQVRLIVAYGLGRVNSRVARQGQFKVGVRLTKSGFVILSEAKNLGWWAWYKGRHPRFFASLRMTRRSWVPRPRHFPDFELTLVARLPSGQ